MTLPMLILAESKRTGSIEKKKKKFELTYPEYQQRVRLDCSIGHSYRLVLIAMQFELHQPPNLP